MDLVNKRFIISILIFFPFLVVSQNLSDEELKLYTIINDYRNSKGLNNITISKSLTFVAQTHVRDLANYKPDQGNCNMHSWSNMGKWTACCYTDDHRKAKCMWDKPRELTKYDGDGYEIAMGFPDENYKANAIEALSSWKSSKGHNEVIINKGIWKDNDWNAIGIGIYKNYAVVWFGIDEDKN